MRFTADKTAKIAVDTPRNKIATTLTDYAADK